MSPVDGVDPTAFLEGCGIAEGPESIGLSIGIEMVLAV